jgi:sec-independent protein translocase protein TatB
MFDIGFSELIVIGIVALVVIGPERLPRVARTTGLLLGRLQRYVADVKADIGRELQLEELKKLQAEVQQSAHDLERSITDEMRSIERDVGQAVDSIKADALSAPPSGADPAANGALPCDASPPVDKG